MLETRLEYSDWGTVGVNYTRRQQRYAYDAFGRRAYTYDFYDGVYSDPTTITYYSYDGEMVNTELDQGRNVTRRYMVSDTQRFGRVDTPMLGADTQFFVYLTDHKGSITHFVNFTGVPCY